MKLIRLVLENIASVERAEIRFDRPPLSEASLFLITGDTGAGKSTLLDAVCLALYNTTPRLEQAPSGRANFGTDVLAPRNPANLLRHGTSRAEASLRFEGSDGVIYEASWQVRRNRNGKLTAPEQRLSWNGGEALNQEARRKITEEAVGLDFAQFCRTTVLAQGQFSRFLKSNDDEKSALLEKMTGTGIYSAIGRSIEALRKERESAYQLQRSRTAGIVLLAPEQRAELETSLHRLSGERTSLEQDLAAAGVRLAWTETLVRLESERRELERRCAERQARLASPEFLEESRLLADFDRTEAPRRCLERLAEQDRRLAGLEQERKGLRATRRRLLAAERRTVRELDRREAERASVRQQLERDSGNAPMYDAKEELLVRLGTALEALHSAGGHERAARETARQLAVSQQEAAAAGAELKRAAAEAEARRREAEAVAAEFRALHPEGLAAALQQAGERIGILERLQRLLQERQETLSRRTALQQACTALETEIREHTAESERRTVQCRELAAAAAEARRAWENADVSLSEWAADIRSRLRPGDACPVCGQTVASLTTETACRERLRPLRERCEKLEQAYREESVACAALEKSRKHLDGQLALRRQEAEAETGRLTRVRTLLEEVRETWPSAFPEFPEFPEEMPALHLEQARAEETACRARLTQALQVQTRLEQLNRQLQETDRVRAGLEKTGEAFRIRCAALQEKALREQETAVSDRDRAAGELDRAASRMTWPGWRESLLQEGTAFLERFAASADDYRQAREAERLLAEETERIRRWLERAGAVRNRLPVWFREEPEPGDGIDDAGEADGCSGEELAEAWHRLSERLAAWTGARQDGERQRAALETELEAFFRTCPDLDRTRLERLCAVTDWPRRRAYHQQALADAEAARQALEEKQRQYREHRQAEPAPESDATGAGEFPAAFPAECTPEQMLQHWQELQRSLRDRLDRLLSETGRLEQRLREDRENRERHRLSLEQEESLRRSFEEWDRLNGLLGGGDGKHFRRVAQGFVLGDLLHRANGYLLQLNRRYRLDGEPGTLNIRMTDLYQGQAQGPVDIISGGEGFLVSLSLALALSSLNRRHFSIDTLFIDEGFGSLSGDVLSGVMNLLGRLQHLNGKRVGIISHVESLKERIPVQIRVRRTDPVSSTVTVTNNGIESEETE